MSSRVPRAAGIALALALDRWLADPQQHHPVAGFGQLATTLETRTYRDSRAAGALHAGILVAAVTAAGWAAEHTVRRAPILSTALTAAGVWATLGGTTLVDTGSRMSDLLCGNEVDGARALLPSLCGREPQSLDIDGLARAAVESLAENTSDAHTGAVLWAALFGVPGALAYRAVNTLDAMIGHKSQRYRNFGWASARLDDVMNLLPARLTAAMAAVLAPSVGGSAIASVRSWFRDGHRHPSPNAGVVEAAFAGALGLRLGGPVRYTYGDQSRPTLGDGRRARPVDVRAAVELSRRVQTATVVTVVAAVLRQRRP